MSSTAPPTRPRTATSANGTRNQVGSSVVSAPIGSAPIAADRSPEEPASSRPKISSTTGASAAPNVVQPTTPRLEDGPRQVARVVGGGVDPAEAEAGHHEHQRADERLRSSRPAGR